MGFSHLHGAQPGADCRHGRELPHGLLWKNFMANPEIAALLKKLDAAAKN
jgi:hypothetical protein